ncbi:Hypothetical protein A7982_06194 [Minicystis rosea]|nr:Hypothetical protein A7982_06194 [Minicystis rosea]
MPFPMAWRRYLTNASVFLFQCDKCLKFSESSSIEMKPAHPSPQTAKCNGHLMKHTKMDSAALKFDGKLPRTDPRCFQPNTIEGAKTGLAKLAPIDGPYLTDLEGEIQFRKNVMDAAETKKAKFSKYCKSPSTWDLALARTLYHLFLSHSQLKQSGCLGVASLTGGGFLVSFSGGSEKTEALETQFNSLFRMASCACSPRVNEGWQKYLSEFEAVGADADELVGKNCAESKLFANEPETISKIAGITVIWIGAKDMRDELCLVDGAKGAGSIMLPCEYCQNLLPAFLDETLKS